MSDDNTSKLYLCLSYAHSTCSNDDWTVVGLADDPEAWDAVRERVLATYHDDRANGGYADCGHVAAVKVVALAADEFRAVEQTEHMRLSVCWSESP